MDWELQCKLIPDGVQTLSKMPSKYVDGVYPKFIVKGKGAHVWDDIGKEYIDFPLGLGTILLGHCFDVVDESVRSQMKLGNLFSLPNRLEGEAAQRIKTLFSCAEKVRFLKTGSESTSAAIKIARAYTGRKKILCCGYHGWHDWYNITTQKNKGVPDEFIRLCIPFPFNDVKSFSELMDDTVAAVILEPYVYEAPDNKFLSELKKQTKKNGSVLIFDEVVTGLRTRHHSAQRFFKITPDLTAFGKALGNGYSIGGVCGKSDLMDVLRGDCFVSSTFGGELMGLAAARATIDFCLENNVSEMIWSVGSKFKDGYNSTAKEAGVSTKCIGYPCRTFLEFPSAAHRSLFWQECVKKGILFGHAQFVSYSHTFRMIQEILSKIYDIFFDMQNRWEDPEISLEGKIAQETLRHETKTIDKGTDRAGKTMEKRQSGDAQNAVSTD